MTIGKPLNNLGKPALISIIVDLYGRYGDIDDIIETHLEQFSDQESALSNDIPDGAFTRSLQRQITQLITEDDFIDYHGAYDFSCRLQSLLLDLEALAEEAPSQALELLENFLNGQESLLNYVDDSDGEVGYALRCGVDLWLTIAADVRANGAEERSWVDVVLHFFDHNDYGCFDNIISHSRELLTEDELRQLAWRFENDAKKAKKKQRSKGYNLEAAHACIGLYGVAEALDDISLYEKGTLLQSPKPNTLQIEQIVLFALEIQDLQRAEYWLQQPQWREDKARYTRLHNQLLEQQGNIEQLKRNLLQSFNETPTEHTLEAYWQFADNKERQAVKKQIKAQIEAMEDREQAISLLLIVDAVKPAAQYLLKHYEALPRMYYGTLLSWLETFEDNQQNLAMVVCYRLLLSDLLERGYSKAYHHGARYFHQLLALDKIIKNYKGLCSATEFIRQIQEKHWRKRSFWAEANWPNKPQ